jgi:hypothetical protein
MTSAGSGSASGAKERLPPIQATTGGEVVGHVHTSTLPGRYVTVLSNRPGAQQPARADGVFLRRAATCIFVIHNRDACQRITEANAQAQEQNGARRSCTVAKALRL